MKKQIIVVLISIIIILAILVNMNVESKKQINIHYISNNQIFVDDDNINGPWDGSINHPYKHIKDALENASDESIINVFDGIYYENIIINKKIALKGLDKTETIIDGMNNQNVVEIEHNDIVIKNFTIRNSGGYKENCGLKIKSNNNIVNNCIFYRSKSGIISLNSKNNRIEKCIFENNGQGISFYNCQNSDIIGSYFDHNSFGLNIDRSHYCNIKYCTIKTNGIAMFLNKSTNLELFHSLIIDNSVNLGGGYINDCQNVNIYNSIFKHNGAGLCIYSSEKINIDFCSLTHNTHFAISLRRPSDDVSITNCEIRDNLRYGVYAEKNNHCKINHNNLYQNNLYSVYSKFAFCNIKNNYWGTTKGPSLFDRDRKSRITYLPILIQFIPWSIEKYEDIGATWNINNNCTEPIEFSKISIKLSFSDLDSDKDGLPDWWEEKWDYNPNVWNDHEKLDPDNDALNNFEECYTDQYGSNPFKKDIFVEIDYMTPLDPNKPNYPNQQVIQKIIKIYQNQNISLHLDFGNLGGGEEIPNHVYCYSFEKLRNYYWDYFLHNNLDNPRKGIFHYGIICNYCPDLNFPFFGWDNLDSFAISAEWLQNSFPLVNRDELIIGAISHHLGHHLGLIPDVHDGIDNIGTLSIFSKQWFKFYNYKSCMNYYYKYKIIDFSDGSNGINDFDDWSHLIFDFFKNTEFNIQ